MIENFKLYHCIEHCKHVMLASSGDGGYVTFLRPYSACTTGLSLLKSLPFPANFLTLAGKFKVKEFDDIFKVEKFTPRVPRPSADSTGVVTYATATSSSPRIPTMPVPVDTRQREATTPTTKPPMPTTQRDMRFNRYKQRLDKQLSWDPERVRALLPEKLCLKFFLAQCEKTEYGCEHHHKYRNTSTLNDGDKQALTRIARQRPCFNGLHCEDRNCLFGHECIHGDRCNFGGDCKFSREMHQVDKEGAHFV